MSLIAAAWLGIAVVCLMSVDIGHVFWQQREVQRIADLSAMAGATSSYAQCAPTATANAHSNGLSPDAQVDTAQVECGNWDPSFMETAAPGMPNQHFRNDPSLRFNAARVTVSRHVPYLLFFSAAANSSARTVRASATATVRNMAGFSLGTGLASLQGGLVNQLLGSLLGTGNSLSLDILSYQGMANASVNLLDLISAMPSVGTVQELLDAQVRVGDFIAAMARAVNPQETAAITALNAIVNAGVRSTRIRVSDVLQVSTPTPESAATAEVNLLQLLMVAAQVANGTNAVNLGAALNLGPLAQVSTRLVIVEPPAIAIGEAGRDANGNWKTQAHSAVVRMKLEAEVLNNINVGLLGNISALRLPIYLESTPGDAWLADVQCGATRPESVVSIGSRPGVANLCIAEVSDTQMSNTTAPTSCGTPATITDITLLGLPVAQVRARVPLTGMTPLESAPLLEFDGVIGNEDDIQRTDSNAVGSVLSTAVGSLASGLQLQCTVLTLNLCGLLNLNSLLSTLNSAIITPLAGLLDSVFQPLLGLLGVQLGYSDVHHQSLGCGEPMLVY